MIIGAGEGGTGDTKEEDGPEPVSLPPRLCICTWLRAVVLSQHPHSNTRSSGSAVVTEPLKRRKAASRELRRLSLAHVVPELSLSVVSWQINCGRLLTSL